MHAYSDTQAASGPEATSERRISRRLDALLPSATLAVDARAKQLRASGVDIIGFGAGEPDFPTPKGPVTAAIEACANPVNHHYTPAAGIGELREVIARKTLADTGLDVKASQVVVTNGAKHAIYNTFAALIDPGDEVLVPTPYWTTYPESASLAGGIPVAVETREESGFRVSVEQLDAARTPRTKVLVFVSPSNPTGAVYPREEIEAIGQWALDAGIWVLTDEIYGNLVYPPSEHHSLPVLVPGIKSRCVVVNGVSKTYAMTGWRVGWMIAPEDVARAASNFQSQTTSNVSNVAQAAAIAALFGDQSSASEMREEFDRRRQRMCEMLREIRGVTFVEPQGAFYAFPSLKGVLGRSIAGSLVSTTSDLAEIALEHARVAVVPGEAFGAPGYIRLSYAMALDDMVEGMNRLAELLASAR
ncbi:MAG: pyridoxal phosphate-dependent aminotransferase [Actinomycetota bacterium]|nr:pyridoxal phosphate-dependent aminotransferase [Actinomycetota bacterium]